MKVFIQYNQEVDADTGNPISTRFRTGHEIPAVTTTLVRMNSIECESFDDIVERVALFFHKKHYEGRVIRVFAEPSDYRTLEKQAYSVANTRIENLFYGFRISIHGFTFTFTYIDSI